MEEAIFFYENRLYLRLFVIRQLWVAVQRKVCKEISGGRQNAKFSFALYCN